MRAALLTLTAILVPAAAEAQQARSPWSLAARFTSVYDSNVDRNAESLDAYGASAGLMARYTARPGPHRATLEYEIAGHGYSGTDRWDRISHRARAGAVLKLGRRWRLGAAAEASRRGSTEDRELADVLVVEPELVLDVGPSTRLGLAAGHRWKRFADDPGRQAVNPYARVEARQRVPGGWALELGSRLESSETDDPRDRYRRWTHAAALEGELGRHVEVELELRYRDRWYAARTVEVNGPDGATRTFLRRDRNWIPAAGATVRLSRGLDLEVDYRFEIRRSNDPDKAFDAHQLTIGTRAVW